MSLSEEKQFALEVLDIFDELARPEIKNRLIRQIWNGAEWLKFPGIYKWIQGIIIQKPDEELNEKMFMVYQKLGKKFKKLDTSLEINAAEKMGSVKIPQVGELAKTQKLTKVSKEQANQLMEELF